MSTSTYQEFLKQLEKNKLSSFYLLLGSDKSLISEGINKLKEYLFLNLNLTSFNINYFGEENKSLSEIINVCETFPFASSKRLVIIEDILIFSQKEQEELSKYLEKIPVYLHLVLSAHNLKSSHFIYKLAQKNNSLFCFYPLSFFQMADYIKKFSFKNGLIFTPQATTYLIETLGQDLVFLKKELEKYLLYFDKNKEVDKDDLALIISRPSYQEEIFNFLAALGVRNLKDSIYFFKRLMNKGEPVVKIFFMITKHLRLLYQLKSLDLENSAPFDILKRLNLRSVKQASSLLSQSKNYSQLELKNLYKKLVEIDCQLKTQSQNHSSVIMEIFIVDLCQN
ncbi:DNA polymerase III subunit delta [bacterium]|nr:DNA polymerase III subunit delta [bacterium]MBU1153123.1 DNA polymerase III subunit delta [bacterium]